MKLLGVTFSDKISQQADVLKQLKQQLDLLRKKSGFNISSIENKKFIELIRVKINHDCTYIYKLKDSDVYQHIPYSPTGNCQFSCIASFMGLITGKVYFVHNLQGYLDFLSDYLYEVLAEVNKPMFLLDLKKVHLEDTKNIFKSYTEIVFENPYLSTNGSNMVMIMFKRVPKKKTVNLEDLAKAKATPVVPTPVPIPEFV